MIELLGWIGSTCLGICAIPWVVESTQDKSSNNLTKGKFFFLVLWLLGEIFSMVYVLAKHGIDLPLIANYGLNIIFILIIFNFARLR